MCCRIAAALLLVPERKRRSVAVVAITPVLVCALHWDSTLVPLLTRVPLSTALFAGLWGPAQPRLRFASRVSRHCGTFGAGAPLVFSGPHRRVHVL